MTILRLAHLDAESLVMDGRVRSLRDQFVTFNWSELLYNGLYFSPEREFIENSLVFSQRRVVCGHYLYHLQCQTLTYVSQLECRGTTSMLQGLRFCPWQKFRDREALLLRGGFYGLIG